MRASTIWFGLMLSGPGIFALAQGHGEEVILSPIELAALERENAMWRATRVDESVEQNLQRWQAAGFTTADSAALQPRLRAIWDIEPARQFGWLPAETVERIQAVDREFIVRWRAVRRYEVTGIRSDHKLPEDRANLNRAWQRAILRALDARDVAEYRLMNSWSAQTVHRLAKGVALQTQERRMLCHWQREFDGVHGAENKFDVRFRQAEFKAARLEHWSQFRALLGDHRFATYLGNAEPDFAQLVHALHQTDHTGETAALDLWFIRQRYEVARMRIARSDQRGRLRDATVEQATALLGGKDFLAYRETENAAWLN